MSDAPTFRRTRQREAIYNALSEAERPLNFEELLERARMHFPKIGERTVFRNVREMLDEHSLVRVYLPGQPARYVLPTGNHCPHFICRNCNNVFVLPEETPDILPGYASKIPPEFIPEGEEVIIYGYCRECPPE
ncbi:Fur family transcriptional regulator [Cerasicoccus fimbriatus]|uniref:Fur family transcriptional regulator n=1 Tax=Cerasicoccus fimbriatus TaxID=3014554 RepID=UPI0022B5A3B3|nr:transcriptional repressor [Cerasicoccus sp. TK19100]